MSNAFEGAVAILDIVVQSCVHAEPCHAEIRVPCSPTRRPDAERQRTGSRHHRSAAEQIEYWASLGPQVAGFVDRDRLLDVAAGLARLKIEPILAQPGRPEAVFAAVEADRDSGMLPEKVSIAAIRYQASRTHPGYLHRIHHNGIRTLGTVDGGVFTSIRSPIGPRRCWAAAETHYSDTNAP